MNTHRPRKKIQRVGRGCGSRRGKTCGRGSKGDKARCGYRQNYGREGGRTPLYRKIPTRGFPNTRFQSKVFAVDLATIDKHFNDGEVVNFSSLREKGLAPRKIGGGIKVLSSGEISKKKISIEAHYYSKATIEKLKKGSISHKTVSLNKA